MAHEFGWFLVAEYESGYRLIEDEDDRSPYDPGKNVCHAIMQCRPQDHGHGRMVRFSLLPTTQRGVEGYTLDWRPLWEKRDPGPIYYREMSKRLDMLGEVEYPTQCVKHVFGFQYLDEAGHNVTVVEEITGDGDPPPEQIE